MVMVEDVDRRVDGTAPKRTRLRGPERREMILRAAAEVFGQAGYRAGKVADVAARVGVTEPVIFQNFGSKAALFAAVLERAAADVQASLDDLAAGFGSASELLGHVLTGSAHRRPARATTELPAQQPGTGHPGTGHPGAGYGVLFADAATLAAEPELSEPARAAVRAIAAHLAGLIQRAQADGDLRPDADPEAAAWLLLSVLSARRLRAAAMPAGLEPAVTALAQQALAPPTAAGRRLGQAPPDAQSGPADAGA
jgi:AcrR family transcriptional regulator